MLPPPKQMPPPKFAPPALPSAANDPELLGKHHMEAFMWLSLHADANS